jgi:hypothetical protein
MMCRQKTYGTSSFVKAKHCAGAYRLPLGLPNGAIVRVVSTGTGYIKVQLGRKRFTVSMACVDSGWEFLFRGRWYDERDPLIVRLRSKAKRRAAA